MIEAFYSFKLSNISPSVFQIAIYRDFHVDSKLISRATTNELADTSIRESHSERSETADPNE